MEKKILDSQRQQWQNAFLENREMFGTEPSDPARKSAALFRREGRIKVLELGCGQGRDTIHFARNGLQVHALDYSDRGLEDIRRNAGKLGLSRRIVAQCHDVRDRLPFADETFDACYSHMLLCMAFTTEQLQFLSGEIRRVLTPDGLHVYTVRNTDDAHYKTGLHHGEDMYEADGFIVHFFSRATVELLAAGYETAVIDEFEEGELPRRLFRVTSRKGP